MPVKNLCIGLEGQVNRLNGAFTPATRSTAMWALDLINQGITPHTADEHFSIAVDKVNGEVPTDPDTAKFGIIHFYDRYRQEDKIAGFQPSKSLFGCSLD